MGNTISCVSAKSKYPKKSEYPEKLSKESFKSYLDSSKPVAPDLLPQNGRMHRPSQSGEPSTPDLSKADNQNNNYNNQVFTFETAFKISQLSNTMTTVPIKQREESVKIKNNSENCYINIKPFIQPLPPVPTEDTPAIDEQNCDPIPVEEVTPPLTRRAPPRLPSDDFSDSLMTPSLPPKPSNLILSALAPLSSAREVDNISNGSAAKTPLPRKVLFEAVDHNLDLENVKPSPETETSACSSPESEALSSVITKRPKKPPRNYSYKASTLPKRISHTTEEVMELWDEVRKAISLEKLQETTSLHISEEDEDIDEIYQNLYAARMRSWQIMCLAQDVLLEFLNPSLIWDQFIAESLITEEDLLSFESGSLSQQDLTQRIIEQILKHGDGWFDKLREILRSHETQKCVSNLLEALNEVFIIGAKANRWSFSLTTKHCTVQVAKLRQFPDQPDLIGDTSDGHQPILILELYNENFGNSSCASLSDVLKKYDVISQLNIGKNKITAKGLAKLVNGIEGNKCLEKLNLRLNPLENNGLELLTNALANNNSLREVILSCTQIKDGCGKPLSSFLRRNTPLQVLDLSFNDVSDDDCNLICDALKENEFILTLNLRENQLTKQSCFYLSRLLQTNCPLETLDISHNKILDCGIKILSESLISCYTLREIHVECCGITSHGCIELADALATNHSVAALYLSNNNIGDDGCEALAEMLIVNTTLQILYINMCSINRRGLHRMLVVISHDNYVLRSLGACYNNILLYDDDLVQDGFEAVDIRNALNRALESNHERKILTWGKL